MAAPIRPGTAAFTRLVREMTPGDLPASKGLGMGSVQARQAMQRLREVEQAQADEQALAHPLSYLAAGLTPVHPLRYLAAGLTPDEVMALFEECGQPLSEDQAAALALAAAAFNPDAEATDDGDPASGDALPAGGDGAPADGGDAATGPEGVEPAAVVEVAPLQATGSEPLFVDRSFAGTPEDRAQQPQDGGEGIDLSGTLSGASAAPAPALAPETAKPARKSRKAAADGEGR